MSATTKAKLREALLSIARPPSHDADSRLTLGVRQALLDFGSATDDNVAAVDRISVGALKKSTRREDWGLRLADSGLALSDVINSAEGSPIPQQVRANYPNLTQEDWDAVLRVACLALLSLEGERTG